MTLALSSRRMPSWLVLIGSMTALGPFSIDMYLPGFPSIEQDFGTTGVERTMATFMLGIAVGQLLYGPLSDRFGRKPPLYIGLTLYALGALGCALATSMSMLIAMRVVQAIGACAPMVIGRAVVRDRCEPHEAARAYSMLMTITSVGPIVAPALGGIVVTVFGWRAVFVFQAVAGVLLTIAMHRWLVESRDASHVSALSVPRMFVSYGRLLRDRTLMSYALLSGFAMGAMFCYVTGAPMVMTEHYRLTPQQFGWLIGLNGIAFLSASRLNIRALRTRTPAQVLARAIWLPVIFAIALAVAGLLGPVQLWITAALQFCFFISVGRVSPNVSALALEPHGRSAATAAAVLGCLQSLLGMVAGTAVDLFGDGTLLRLAEIMTGCALCSVACYFAARRARSATQQGSC